MTGSAHIPEAAAAYCRENGLGQVERAEPVGGGCINAGSVLTTRSGERLFLKHNPSAPADMFTREAEGLLALAGAGQRRGGPRVPRPLLAGADCLLLEYLPPAPRAAGYWERLGQELARLHSATRPQFGFPHDNYIGSTPQPNPPETDGYSFFAEHRLLFQGQLARRAGRLDAAAFKRLENIAGRLRDLVPGQPASLIHGDLWGGNVIAGPEGRACLIDPAAHFGWAEAELAMTALFGGFPQSFYDAYTSTRPLEAGYSARFDLYNLYHLLNHLNLFGQGYLGQVEAVLRRYA